MTTSTYVVKRKIGQVPLWRKARPRLERLDIELTERCNNDCVHCCINRPVGDVSARAREMTTEQIKDLLHQAAELGCLQVRFTGGEALLRTDFQELYICARRLGIKVSLFTNARLITSPLADLFSRIPTLAPIEITVYGMHEESYEAVTRSRGSFAQFRQGVNHLLERKIPFIVKSVLLPHNKHEIDEFESWARTIPWMTKSPSYPMFLDLRSRRDDAGKDALIKSLRLPPEEVVAILTRDADRYRRTITAFAQKFMGPPGTVLFECGAGHAICIDAYGIVQPCLGNRAPGLTVDLMSRASTKEGEESASISSVPGGRGGAVNLSDALAQISRLCDVRVEDPEYLRRCAKCFLHGLCEQCPAKSWTEHGNLSTPVEHLCEIAHAHARYLGWLGKEENGWEVMDWRERVGRETLVASSLKVPACSHE